MRFIKEGGWDRANRIVVGIGLAGVAIVTWPAGSFLSIAGVVTMFFLLFGAVAFFTGLFGRNPVYGFFYDLVGVDRGVGRRRVTK